MKYIRLVFFILGLILFVFIKSLLSVLALNQNYAFLVIVLWLVVGFLFNSFNENLNSTIKNQQKQKDLKSLQKRRRHLLNKIIETTTPDWTPEVLQSLNFKQFFNLVKSYFELKGFQIDYPASFAKNTEDVFFLYTPENIRFAIVKCRAIGGDLVSLETVRSFSDLSKQYGVINLALATTGYFENDLEGLTKNKKGFNLIGAPQLISMLTALPIEEQTYLFANMMLNKN